MVIEETQTTITPEIVTVDDLIGRAEAVPAAASMPSGSPNVDKLEQWIRLLDKGLSIADRGITILGKADNIVRNLTEVIMKNNNQQQQQQPQQVLYQVQQQPQPMPAAVEGVADAEDQQVRPTSAEAVPAQNDLGQHGNIGQLVTAERISSVLSMLLGQCPDMTVKELKELIDRNPDTINTMLKVLK